MNPLEAIGIAEGFVETDSEEKYVEAWQYLLDTGLNKNHTVHPCLLMTSMM